MTGLRTLRCAPRYFCLFYPCAPLPAPAWATHSNLNPVNVSFPAPFPQIFFLYPLTPSAFCRLKGLISPAGKNRSAESLTGDRWATFFWPQRGRSGALRGIQMRRSRGSRLLAGPGRPYGACREDGEEAGVGAGERGAGVGGGWERSKAEGAGAGGGRKGAHSRDACAGAGLRDLRASPLPAPPALSITNSAI